MNLLHALLVLCGLVLLTLTLPLVIELCVLSLAALAPARKLPSTDASDLRLFVVIPAHDEEKLIGACVRSVRASSLTSGVEIYVVAHNCTDRTQACAEEAGATVLVLNDAVGGKGAALHHGFTHALHAGADAALVIDADSVVSPHIVEHVRAALGAGAGALQCCYEVSNPEANPRTRLMALSLLGMNVLRPRGRSRLGLSCGIFGNGFALTAETLRRVPYVANSLVEDLEYHLHLLRAGIRVDFLSEATVYSEMPDSSAAAATQRARWEGGRLLMRRQFTLPLVREVLRGRLRFLEPLLDLLALPLATVTGLLLLALMLPLVWLRIYAAAGLGSVVLYLVASASFSGEPLKTLQALAAAPGYMLWKLAMLPRTRMAARKNASWVRTARNVTQPPPPGDI